MLLQQEPSTLTSNAKKNVEGEHLCQEGEHSGRVEKNLLGWAMLIEDVMTEEQAESRGGSVNSEVRASTTFHSSAFELTLDCRRR